MSKKVLNKPITVDDQGNEVYICQYSKKPVSTDSALMLGPLMANVSGTYVCHPEGFHSRVDSKKNFDEMDANCNTCKNLQRIPHEKRKDGQLVGVCKLKSEQLLFHPDDWMGKECWEARKETR